MSADTSVSPSMNIFLFLIKQIPPASKSHHILPLVVLRKKSGTI
jgi:hypothetical protein